MCCIWQKTVMSKNAKNGDFRTQYAAAQSGAMWEGILANNRNEVGNLIISFSFSIIMLYGYF